MVPAVQEEQVFRIQIKINDMNNKFQANNKSHLMHFDNHYNKVIVFQNIQTDIDILLSMTFSTQNMVVKF